MIMVFSSLLFLFRFLPAVLLVYYIVPCGWRNLALLVFSLVFYAWGEPVFIVLMAASIVVSYIGGLGTGWCMDRGKRNGARWLAVVSCGFSLSLLAFFKYGDFAIETVNRVLETNFPLLRLGLPIGISFYTFQTMSYIMDVYRGKTAARRNLISYGAYVAMFPQLIAGPIVQYKTIERQLGGPCHTRRRETPERFAKGVRRFCLGLGKKVLLANNAGVLWDTVRVMDYGTLPVLTGWLGLGAYTLQIYFDFSAYSDMAIGLGHMFGFRFLENFDYPYTAKSITEFWRRWHISLGTWFREYVYIPLGGNRTGRARQIRNILIVWLLTGIWHGASWNFVLWGLYYGALLLVEKLLIGKGLEKAPGLLRHVYCIFFVMLGWNLFVFEDLVEGIGFLKSLWGCYGQGLLNRETIYLLYNHGVLMILCLLGCTRLPKRAGERVGAALKKRPYVFAAVRNGGYAAVFLLSVAWLVDAAFNPFLYFRF